MRDKLQKIWRLVLLLFDSVEASVKRQSARRCGENWERPYPKNPTREDLPQRPLARFGGFGLCRVPRVALIAIFLVMMLAIPTTNRAQTQHETRLTSSEPVPEPAVPAILAAFDKYEIVAMPQGHGMQDLNDFIFSLIRNPAFSEKVNDIEVEFGNSLYQPILDRYIAGENVRFTEVQKVWRKMGQPASGASGFVEQFFPLVRALNQKLPPESRVRVLAGDSPVD
jgi:hypothetical protein